MTIQEAVERASVAWNVYRNSVGGGSDDEVFTDLLADLMHLAAEIAPDLEATFDELMAVAQSHYNAEKED